MWDDARSIFHCIHCLYLKDLKQEKSNFFTLFHEAHERKFLIGPSYAPSLLMASSVTAPEYQGERCCILFPVLDFK